MNKTAFRVGVAVIAIGVLGGAGAIAHGRRVSAFVDNVAISFSDRPMDAGLVRSAGYPAGFLRAKIAAGEFKSIKDAPKLLRAYKKLTIRQETDTTLELYTYQVGLNPFDEMILLRYDEFGKLLGMPVDGANWR